jgi:hypothetical protein
VPRDDGIGLTAQSQRHSGPGSQKPGPQAPVDRLISVSSPSAAVRQAGGGGDVSQAATLPAFETQQRGAAMPITLPSEKIHGGATPTVSARSICEKHNDHRGQESDLQRRAIARGSG